MSQIFSPKETRLFPDCAAINPNLIENELFGHEKEVSFARTRSHLVSTTLEMGCNVVEPSYLRPRRGILERGRFQPIYHLPSEDHSGHVTNCIFRFLSLKYGMKRKEELRWRL
jgi:hypothetical protein